MTGEKLKPPENTCREKAAWYRTIHARKAAAKINPIFLNSCNVCLISLRYDWSFICWPLLSSPENIFSAAMLLETCTKSTTEFCMSCVYIQVATSTCHFYLTNNVIIRWGWMKSKLAFYSNLEFNIIFVFVIL